MGNEINELLLYLEYDSVYGLNISKMQKKDIVLRFGICIRSIEYDTGTRSNGFCNIMNLRIITRSNFIRCTRHKIINFKTDVIHFPVRE